MGDGWHNYEVTDWDAIFNGANKIIEKGKKEASGKADVNKYPPIAASMECMQKLKGGKAAAHQLAVFFREQYRRRSSMMAAIKKF